MDEPLKISSADRTAVQRGAAALRAGELVAFPTETVYGLGANALDERAVARVFEAKGRPRFDPLIVHVADAAAVRGLAADWPEMAQRLADAFWPGPMTLVLPKRFEGTTGTPQRKPVIADLVTAGLPTVAVRVPDHVLALALLREAGVPVAAPSANRFGSVSPTTANHVRDELGDAVSIVLDGGPCRTGVESTVLSLVEPDVVRVLRLGGLAVEAVERVVGRVSLVEPSAVAAAQREQEVKGQQSPGMLERHYAPRTPMRLVGRISDFRFPISDFEPGGTVRVGLMVLAQGPEAGQSAIGNRQSKIEIVHIERLSPTGDLAEAAANLFAAMRRLDAAGADVIVAERVPDEGLGRAINDRLRRAASG